MQQWTPALSDKALIVDRPWLILCWGAPAAGKSTLAREFARRHGVPRLSSDEVNRALIGEHYRAELRQPIYQGLLAMAAAVLAQAGQLVVDGTFLEESARSQLEQLCQQHRAGWLSVEVRCALPERMRRNRLRDGAERVDEDWLRNAHYRALRSRLHRHLSLDTSIVSVGEGVEAVKACLHQRLCRLHGIQRKPWGALAPHVDPFSYP